MTQLKSEANPLVKAMESDVAAGFDSDLGFAAGSRGRPFLYTEWAESAA